VVEGSRRFSYRELNSQANQLARHLIQAGVGPDRCVAVLLPRSADLVVALLAILKAGGAYLPLDHTHPFTRTVEILRDSGPVALVTHDSVWGPNAKACEREFAPSTLLHRVVDLQAATRPWSKQLRSDIAREEVTVKPSDLAYVIYTSGSTGMPKGVANTHAGLMNRLEWFVDSIATAAPVTALKTSIGFVDSVTEILQTLLAGGRLIVVDGGVTRVVSASSAGCPGCRFGVD
jgi:non-ribosomal peptide synthetase component F